jgi:deglycase
VRPHILLSRQRGPSDRRHSQSHRKHGPFGPGHEDHARGGREAPREATSLPKVIAKMSVTRFLSLVRRWSDYKGTGSWSWAAFPMVDNTVFGQCTGEWGQSYDVDVPLKKAKPGNYDALVLPGGVMNPDKLRLDRKAVQFVRSFFDDGKPVGAIRHGPWTLIEAGVVQGRRLTSWPSLKTDLENAGAQWSDERVIVDAGLVTSRKPGDLPAFNRKLIEEFAGQKHEPGRKGRGSMYAAPALAARGVD